jgi:polyisoprenoid-binding protein YceI
MALMKRSVIGWALAGVLAVGGAAFAYVFWFAGGSGEPSTELTTPELADTSTTVFTGSTQGTPETTVGAGGGPATFVIDQRQSTVRFEIDEVLNGNPTHVVGITDQVVGQVRIDPADLSSAEFSDIVVNARTLTTGTDRRDRAIRGPVILDSGSDANELVTLAITSVDSLPGAASAGETVEFTITGDLTIKGNTHPVTFDATVSLIDATTLEGTATAEVTRDMFEIGIPSVPNVADVTNEVLLGIEFVAVSR